MRLIPALDILGGRAVRLLRGDFDMVTDYGDPTAAAADLSAQGIELLHVVDLEAARGGNRQLDVLRSLADGGFSFQLGGGIRTADDALEAIDSGAAAVVVGSAITSGIGDAEGIVGAIGSDRVIAALDVRDGRALGSGWLDQGSTLGEAVAVVSRLGVRSALVTGIERDGAMTGPDLALLGQVAGLAGDVDLIASGGVASLRDLRDLVLCDGVAAAVVGRALYEGSFTVEEALRIDGVVA